MWRINTALRGFTVGKAYQALSENNFNVALRNDDGDVQYVEKKYLDEVKAENNKLIRILTSDYACALGIILLNFWCNQKINSFSSLSDMLIVLLFFLQFLLTLKE